MNMPNSPVGTGTIIGFKEVGNTGYVAILTANHVATAGVTTMSLGAGAGKLRDQFPCEGYCDVHDHRRARITLSSFLKTFLSCRARST